MLANGFVIGMVGQALTLNRRTVSFDSRGDVVEAAPTSVSIVGSLQPVNGTNIEAVPEGLRGRASAMLYTQTALNEAKTTQAGDRIDFSGDTYEVIGRVDWNFPGAHYAYVLEKVLV